MTCRRWNRLLLSAVTALVVCGPWIGSHGEEPESRLDGQRQLYREASDALGGGNPARFRELKAQLKDYPLYPYLVYAEYSRSPGQLKPEQVRAFLNKYDDSPLAARLRSQWLHRLRRQNDWRQFLEFYDPALSSTTLACYHQLARYRDGQKAAAIREGLSLWQVGKSQPEACDPIFEILISGGHINDRVAWRRYTLAMLGSQYQLARYIERFFDSDHYRQLAQNFMAVNRDARTIARYPLFSEDTPEVRTVVTHGISHLARSDAPAALRHWHHYLEVMAFRSGDRGDILFTLVRGLYNQDHRDKADHLLAENLAFAPTELLEWRLQRAIREGDWDGVLAWHGHLPAEARAESRWRYWRVRAGELGGSANPEAVQATYTELATERSFYGFLASEWLGRSYQMQHEPAPVPETAVNAMAAREPFLRARELVHHGDRLNARREWYRALRDAPEEEWLTAAVLAQRWQWHHQAIISMTRAGYWNDIQIRFPSPHKTLFSSNADSNRIPLNLLLALSRQESAFEPNIVSPAGARGLMQLMPGTAADTARKQGIPYRGVQDLSDPELNIRLGASYYREMLERFGDNRILATAAYNAGPHRVSRWLRRTEGKLPFDAWIEAIPFRETRHYVQSVLAFSIIYGHLLDQQVTMLNDSEKQAQL